MTTSTSRRSSSSAADRVAAVPAVRLPTAGGTVHVVVTDRADGSFHRDLVPPAELDRRRRAVVPLPWALLDEVHGTDLVELDDPERRGSIDGARGDVIATSLAGHVVGVWVGDCAPVILVRGDGRIVAAHAGWRGLAAGVLDRAIRGLDEGPAIDGAPGDAIGAGADTLAVLGPRIGPCCYEFGDEDLGSVASALGLGRDQVTGVDRRGRPALDVPRTVGAVLARHHIPLRDLGVCTGCDDRFFSHRVRNESGRHVVAAWREAS